MKKKEPPSADPSKPVLPRDFFKQFKNKEAFHLFFNDLFKQGVEEMLQAELDEHLGYHKYAKEGNSTGNSRNGTFSKTVRTESTLSVEFHSINKIPTNAVSRLQLLKVHFILTFMADVSYKIRNTKEIHFFTVAVAEWVDVSARKQYRDILLDSLRHCQKEKGLIIYSWCIMSHHVHLMAKAKAENLSDILRDFKNFTSKQIRKAIAENEKESRRDWMLKIFQQQDVANARNKEFQFWHQDNQPKECYSPAFRVQKLNYIHQNPVEAGLVQKAEDYLYSSARDYYEGRNTGMLEIAFL